MHHVEGVVLGLAIYSSIDPRRADANYKCITYNYIYEQAGKEAKGKRAGEYICKNTQRDRETETRRHVDIQIDICTKALRQGSM